MIPTLLKIFNRIKRTFKRHRGLLIMLIIGCAALLVVNHLASPVHGKQVAVDVYPKKTTVKVKESPASSVDQSLFTLSLPPGYLPQSASTSVSPQLFSQTIIKNGNLGSLIINIGIKNIPEGGLDEDSSYRLRSQQPARYIKTVEQVDGEPVSIINDTESSVVVAFWPHRNYLASISVSSGVDTPGSNDNTDALKALKTVLASWDWK